MTLFRSLWQILFRRGVVFLGLATWAWHLYAGEPDSVRGGRFEGGSELRILFIGNSLTYYNDLPAMFKRFCQAAGRNVYVDSSTASDYLLSQHANSNDSVGKITLQKIRQGGWDYVILQERSDHSAYPHLRTDMGAATRALSQEIRQVGAQPLLYMTWGYLWGDKTYAKQYPQAQTFEGMHKMITDGYLEVGRGLTIPVVPAGYAWSTAKGEWSDAGKWLWNADGNHPQPAGTLMNVGVFYSYLFHADPRQVHDYEGVADHLAKYVLDVAARTVPSQAK